MHGHGDEPGTDNARHLKWIDLMLNDPLDVERYRFFVLVVQCPQGHSWSEQTGSVGEDEKRPDDMLTVTADIVRKTMSECPVDQDRVYGVGISTGAAATWELAMRHPEMFAALVPLANASGSDESRAAKLVKIPIWAFINNGERAGVERMIAAVQAAGGNAYLTVADAWGHDAWSTPLKGEIIEWILAQRRGGPCWWPPGHDAWQWWHILTIPAAVVAFVRLAWSVEQWRRRRVIDSETAGQVVRATSRSASQEAAQSVERTSQAASEGVTIISLSQWERNMAVGAHSAEPSENGDSRGNLPSCPEPLPEREGKALP